MVDLQRKSGRLAEYRRKKQRYLLRYRLSRWLLSLAATLTLASATVGAWQSRNASVNFNVKTHSWHQTNWLDYVIALLSTGLCGVLALIAGLYLLLLSLSATSTEQFWHGYRVGMRQRRQLKILNKKAKGRD
ncbi:hypothetical protein [Shewanella sp.]|uniref:hypothetical protein n=1 Tax=Shewanella sp. TaxID=50422 RepID=UPI003A97B89B